MGVEMHWCWLYHNYIFLKTFISVFGHRFIYRVHRCLVLKSDQSLELSGSWDSLGHERPTQPLDLSFPEGHIFSVTFKGAFEISLSHCCDIIALHAALQPIRCDNCAKWCNDATEKQIWQWPKFGRKSLSTGIKSVTQHTKMDGHMFWHRHCCAFNLLSLLWINLHLQHLSHTVDQIKCDSHCIQNKKQSAVEKVNLSPMKCVWHGKAGYFQCYCYAFSQIYSCDLRRAHLFACLSCPCGHRHS